MKFFITSGPEEGLLDPTASEEGESSNNNGLRQ